MIPYCRLNLTILKKHKSPAHLHDPLIFQPHQPVSRTSPLNRLNLTAAATPLLIHQVQINKIARGRYRLGLVLLHSTITAASFFFLLPLTSTTKLRVLLTVFSCTGRPFSVASPALLLNSQAANVHFPPEVDNQLSSNSSSTR